MGYSGNSLLQEARRSERFPAKFKAELIVDRVRTAVVVADISRTGAMALASDLPEPGTEVVLEGEAFDVVATVVWRRADACGLNFHRSVDPHEVLRQSSLAIARSRAITRGWKRQREGTGSLI